MLWHPERQQLFWFDILANQLLGRDGDTPLTWQFEENVSAAGWTGRDTLLIASETRLFEFNLQTGAETFVAHLEAQDPGSRSNDGRADPQGGFWIGTMAKRGNDRPGAIYRYYRGELRMLFAPVTVPNAMCFTPDGGTAYFSGTRDGKIWRVRLDAQGWPVGDPELFLHHEGRLIDGMVCAADGTLWNTHYKGGSVAVYGADGALLTEHAVPARHTTCPGFGGEDMTTLYISSACQDLAPEICAKEPAHGQTFMLQTETRGQTEHRVIL
ncbi:1,4-lactonase [Candidatus Rhodobacter oscarellae]|uniref:1,4-lactonase n=1 Tax=Candidatus Rhodobacter oscarellae TaxID=1675527 RepID=A0A0J9E0Q3_9RHOB|nr:1,4-lactonase [Candidatus Rhodobacter lobularis]